MALGSSRQAAAAIDVRYRVCGANWEQQPISSGASAWIERASLGAFQPEQFVGKFSLGREGRAQLPRSLARSRFAVFFIVHLRQRSLEGRRSERLSWT